MLSIFCSITGCDQKIEDDFYAKIDYPYFGEDTGEYNLRSPYTNKNDFVFETFDNKEVVDGSNDAFDKYDTDGPLNGGLSPNLINKLGSDEENFSSSTVVSDSSLLDTKRKKIVEYALEHVGNHYVWGGVNINCKDWSPNVKITEKSHGTDCSGFVMTVYKHFNIEIGGHGTTVQAKYFKTKDSKFKSGPNISKDDLKPGDLIFYKPGNSHVAIYTGDGKIVEAKGWKWGITHDRAWNCNYIYGVARPIGTF